MCRVEIADLQEAFTHEVVIADHYTGDTGEEDGISGQVGREVVRGRQQIPWTHYEADESTDITTSANVEIAR